jgi:hypothetical protein
MWCKLRYSQFGSELFDYMPNDLFCHPVTHTVPALETQAAKESPNSDSGIPHPIVDNFLNSVWNGHSSNVPCFPNEVNQGLVIFPLLQMVEGQLRQLTPM